MDNGYEQEPIGPDRVRFTVRPADLPRSRTEPFGVLAGVLVVVGSGGPAGLPLVQRLGAALRAALAVAWAARLVVRRIESGREHLRAPGGTFVVSPSGIEVGDRRIARDVLDGLAVRNPLIGRGASALVRASWALCVEGTVLAGGMSEAVAQGLFADVRRIVDSGNRYRARTRPRTRSFPVR
jgi:hypothetical protein